MESDSLPPLTSADVHVWTLPLDPATVDAGQVKNLLDPEEENRLVRLRCPTHARRFAMAHAGLRLLLSHYCGLPCENVRYLPGRHGKPELPPSASCHFSLSHSHDLALVAVSRQPVGVDLERVEPNLLFEPIAERYFSPMESAILGSLPEQVRLQSFYACWTRKEAYMKACGAGFSLPSKYFAVSLAPGTPPALLHHELDREEPSRWDLHDVFLPEGFTGALATGSGTAGIHQFSGSWDTIPLALPPSMTNY